jgi:hypothetical protein
VAQFPLIAAGAPLTGNLLRDMIPQQVVKTADEPLASNATVQDDDHLYLPVQANATYLFSGWVWYTAASTAVDIRISFGVPSGAQMFRSALGQVNGATTVSGVLDTAVLPAGTADGRGAYTTPLSTVYTGYLITAGTAGTFQLRWAQVAAGADVVTLKAGSWIQLTRTA